MWTTPPSAPAIISRVLEAEGYRVAILPQPDWRDPAAFTALGRPRYGVFVNGGNIDSMVAHYTAAKKRRHDDAYSPGNRAGLRPDRATIVYANRVREVFGDIPLVIGGLEASLRRFAHYDYWEDKVAPVHPPRRPGRPAHPTAWGSGPPGRLPPALAAGHPGGGDSPGSRAPASWPRTPPPARYPGGGRCASFEEVQPEQAGLCPGQPGAVRRARPHPGQGRDPAPREPVPHLQSPRHAPEHRQELDQVCGTALHAGAPPHVRQHGGRARHRGGAVLRHPQPGVLRGLQLLLPGLPPGADGHLPQP